MKCVAKKLNNCKFYFREQEQKKIEDNRSKRCECFAILKCNTMTV